MSQNTTPPAGAPEAHFWCSPDWHNGGLAPADYIIRALAVIPAPIFEPATWTEEPGTFAGPPTMFCVCRYHVAAALESMVGRWGDVRIRAAR